MLVRADVINVQVGVDEAEKGPPIRPNEGLQCPFSRQPRIAIPPLAMHANSGYAHVHHVSDRVDHHHALRLPIADNVGVTRRRRLEESHEDAARRKTPHTRHSLHRLGAEHSEEKQGNAHQQLWIAQSKAEWHSGGRDADRATTWT